MFGCNAKIKPTTFASERPMSNLRGKVASPSARVSHLWGIRHTENAVCPAGSMYFWRIPLPLFGAFVATVSLASVWIGVASLRTRVRSPLVRAVLVSIAATATLLSPLLALEIVRDELERMSKLGIYAHYSPHLFVAPAVLVSALFATSRLLFRARGAENIRWWRLGFWLIAFAFALLNIANWCSPGWCERFGFPFSYSWWSDAIIFMNAENLTAGHSLVALAANIAVFCSAIAALAFSFRRSRLSPSSSTLTKSTSTQFRD